MLQRTQNNQRLIVISVDYEIFGNGLGDVRQHVLQPAERMARICERFQCPLSIYFEVEEYIAFRRYDKELKSKLGYSPADEIEAQIADFVVRGHDIQLHIHPEWFNCKLEPEGWKLDFTKRTVHSLFETQNEMSAYIAERKSILEDLISRSGKAIEVTSFRAGAFSAQPSDRLIPALVENGFVFDSSVAPGLHKTEEHVTIDYKSAPVSSRYWKISNDVATPDLQGRLFEVPIYSKMGRRIQQLTPKRIIAKFSSNTPKQTRKDTLNKIGNKKSFKSITRFLMQRFPIKLDYHNMGANQMIRWIRNAPNPNAGERDIIMLIGHTKEHIRDHDLASLLERVSNDPALNAISLSDVSRILADESAIQPNGSAVEETPSTRA